MLHNVTKKYNYKDMKCIFVLCLKFWAWKTTSKENDFCYQSDIEYVEMSLKCKKDFW